MLGDQGPGRLDGGEPIRGIAAKLVGQSAQPLDQTGPQHGRTDRQGFTLSLTGELVRAREDSRDFLAASVVSQQVSRDGGGSGGESAQRTGRHSPPPVL
jgi:hypothetical protein